MQCLYISLKNKKPVTPNLNTTEFFLKKFIRKNLIVACDSFKIIDKIWILTFVETIMYYCICVILKKIFLNPWGER